MVGYQNPRNVKYMEFLSKGQLGLLLNRYINDCKIIITNCEESEQNEATANECSSFQKQLGQLGGTAPGKFHNFYPHLTFDTIFRVHKLIRNCYLNMNIFFLQNWKFLIMNWPSSYTHQAWKTYPTIWQNMKARGL